MNPAALTIVIMIATAVLLLTEIIPPAASSLLCCLALVLTGILKPAAAFSQFASTNIVLFAAMFVLGHAFFACGLVDDMGTVIRRYSDNEKKLMFIILIVGGLLSAFLSNTSTTAVFLPLIIGIAAATGFSRSRLLYTMMIAVGMGGCVTFLGGPGWLFTKEQIEQAHPGMTVSMFELAKIGLPLFLVSVVYMMTVGYKLTPDRNPEDEAVVEVKQRAEKPGCHKKFVLVDMILTIAAMIFADQLKVNACVSATVGALVLVLAGVISESEAYQAISWKTLFLFGGILPLSTALKDTGAGDMIADVILKAMGNTTNPYIITGVCMLIPCVLSQFLSNATTMAVFTPLGVSVATAIGADPTAVIMAISVGACLAIATPIGQPGNAMIYGPSGLKFIDYAKPGIPLLLIMYLVSVVLIPNLWPFF